MNLHSVMNLPNEFVRMIIQPLIISEGGHRLQCWPAMAILIELFFSCRMGFPGRSVIKNFLVNARRHRRYGFDPWVKKIPWRRKWQPTPVFLLENPMDIGAWWATVHRVAKRWIRLSTHPPPPSHVELKSNSLQLLQTVLI